MAIEKNNSNAMTNLGRYYYHVKKKYSKAKKYFLMAIGKGNKYAMNCIGCYYDCVKKNCDKAKKYLLMAAKEGESCAMNNLGHYYLVIKQNYNKAVKHYYSAIKNGNTISYSNFEFCVEKCHDYKSFINCHANLIKNENFAFVDKLNKFINKHFYQCINFIAENANILHKHLNILENVKFIGKNCCANCNKCVFLIESNCNHNTCFACDKISAKCLLCKKN